MQILGSDAEAAIVQKIVDIISDITRGSRRDRLVALDIECLKDYIFVQGHTGRLLIPALIQNDHVFGFARYAGGEAAITRASLIAPSSEDLALVRHVFFYDEKDGFYPVSLSEIWGDNTDLVAVDGEDIQEDEDWWLDYEPSHESDYAHLYSSSSVDQVPRVPGATIYSETRTTPQTKGRNDNPVRVDAPIQPTTKAPSTHVQPRQATSAQPPRTDRIDTSDLANRLRTVRKDVSSLVEKGLHKHALMEAAGEIESILRRSIQHSEHVPRQSRPIPMPLVCFIATYERLLIPQDAFTLSLELWGIRNDVSHKRKDHPSDVLKTAAYRLLDLGDKILEAVNRKNNQAS
jgi:hypothetical protein